MRHLLRTIVTTSMLASLATGWGAVGHASPNPNPQALNVTADDVNNIISAKLTTGSSDFWSLDFDKEYDMQSLAQSQSGGDSSIAATKVAQLNKQGLLILDFKGFGDGSLHLYSEIILLTTTAKARTAYLSVSSSGGSGCHFVTHIPTGEMKGIGQLRGGIVGSCPIQFFSSSDNSLSNQDMIYFYRNRYVVVIFVQYGDANNTTAVSALARVIDNRIKALH